MSTFRRDKVKCCVCGKPSEEMTCMSTNAFGYSDLDFRPPHSARSTMFMTMKLCPNCGFASPRTLRWSRLENIKEIVYSDEYQNLFKTLPQINSGLKAYLSAYLDEISGDFHHAIEHYKMAAWGFDCPNEECQKVTRMCRDKTMALIEQYDDPYHSFINSPVYIDFKRRNGDFEGALKAIKEVKKWIVNRKNMDKWIKFETELCKNKDTKRHTCEEYMEVERKSVFDF